MNKATTLSYLLSRLIWSHRWHMLFRLSCRSIQEEKNTRNNLTITVIDQSSYTGKAELCRELLALNPSNADYLLDVKRGRAIAVIIHINSHLAHHGFLFIHNRTHKILGLARDTALIGHAFTVPEYRGQGLQAVSISARAQVARDAGFLFVCAETDIANKASQQGMRRGGMEELGEIEVIRIFRTLVVRPTRPAGFNLLGLVF